MSARYIRSWRPFALLLATLSVAARVQASDDEVIDLHGMQVDFHLATKAQREAVMASLDRQIAIATSIELPPNVRDFFRSIRIVVEPAMLQKQTNGEYQQNASPPYVGVKPISLPEERAIVLHELIHAYHHQILKYQSGDIEGAYARARLPGVYPPEYQSAAFLVNSKEFFANMATTFLLGKSERPPFSCSNIVQAQPKFVGYLTSLFGPHPCN